MITPNVTSQHNQDEKSHVGRVRVWTVQPEEVWLNLQEQKSLFVDPKQSHTYQEWPDSVEWMRKQMRKRLPTYRGNYPWWAWFYPKPDIRKLRHGTYSDIPETYVRIELLIPENRVLISNLQAWDWVLLGAAVPYTSSEADYWLNLSDTFEGGVLPSHLQSRSKSTWERIFERDLTSRHQSSDTLDNPMWQENLWQATFEELRLDDVSKVTVFVATPLKREKS